MLFILAVLYFFNLNTSATPVSHVLRDAVLPDANSSSQCICADQQRTLWDILWSCFATIFACTWVSVHPNIPPSTEGWWKTALRRLELMVWALIAPELIILWATRQWYAARTMVKMYQGYEWTKTHGYFIQMGGFTLFSGGKPLRVLLSNEMEDLLRAGKIDFPTITEEEIKDRSKSDGLSKVLVIGQTSWFVSQCIARRAQGLILTELELVTGAFAVLNGIMYFFWWNKPLDVRCPVPVHLLDEWKTPFKFNAVQRPPVSLWDAVLSLYSMAKISLNPSRKSIKTIIVAPWTLIWAVFTRLADIDSPPSYLEVPGAVSTVSTFYARTGYISVTANKSLIPSITSAIATLFGLLHCAAWFFTFPSYAELMIWRVCAAVISTIPFLVLLFFIASFWGWGVKFDSLWNKAFKILPAPLAYSVICLPLATYAIARLLLLAEALAALRYLPPEALSVVDWLSFLPHI
ncbi:hypothetical protein GALMADRAFT_139214 [Galerina marginata CBS 339.88]|uniref:Wax synthase domain-containing protein n=1 Tax=Galerina marginata (strain CBS 339.88) TaxID=685588 RepID=A0A067T4C2_GALM3|nr:hypothetical protein GALMADRAFT_139214 [Galerina marginata CBS 339.88]